MQWRPSTSTSTSTSTTGSLPDPVGTMCSYSHVLSTWDQGSLVQCCPLSLFLKWSSILVHYLKLAIFFVTTHFHFPGNLVTALLICKANLFWSWTQCRWGRWCRRRSWTRPSASRGHRWRRRWQPAGWSGSPPTVAACTGPSKTFKKFFESETHKRKLQKICYQTKGVNTHPSSVSWKTTFRFHGRL